MLALGTILSATATDPDSNTSEFAEDITVQEATSTTLASSANPASVGQPVTFTATVVTNPGFGPPTGTVTFHDGETVLGTGTLDADGVATFTTSDLAPGSHSITATYEGDADFSSSSSTALDQDVDGATSTSLASSANPAAVGQPVTFTATVAGVPVGATPTGTVTFRDGETVLGTGTLDADGVATFTTSDLAPGSHSITATYDGDADYGQSTSAPVAQSVVVAMTKTTLTGTPNPSTFGQPVTLTATVLGVVIRPTGTITFRDGATVLGTAALDANGVATLITSALGVGSHSITATYEGDANFGMSTSAPVPLVVQADSTTTTVASSPNPSMVGQPVTLGASVVSRGGSTPTGTVSFFDGATFLGTATLAPAGASGLTAAGLRALGLGQGAVATLTTSALVEGMHSITAVYNGDANFAAGGSPTPAPQLVVAPAATATATTTTLAPPAGTAVAGQPLTFRATVSGAPGTGTPTPTGPVTFFDGTTVLGVAALNANGVATLTIAGLSAGPHVITAAYGGDASHAGSTSMGANLVIAEASSPSTVTGLQRFGYHFQPTTLVLTFSGPLDPASAETTSNYLIVGRGGRAIAVTRAVYDPATRTVTLSMSRRLRLRGRYQLRARTGQGGSDFVTTFGRETLAGSARSLRASRSISPSIARAVSAQAVDYLLATEGLRARVGASAR